MGIKGALFVLFLVTSLRVSSSEVTCDSSQSDDDCRDPFGSYCDPNGKLKGCVCRPEYPLTVDQVCLQLVDTLDGLCWVSSQCQVLDSDCLRPSGRRLDQVLDVLWDRYASSNGSKSLIPGKCKCRRGWRREGNRCVAYRMGSQCKSGFECSQRLKFSQCLGKKCICIQGFLYDAERDECYSVRKPVSAPCFGEHCSQNETQVQVILQDTFANVVGFVASMGLVLVVWMFCWVCAQRSEQRSSQGVVRMQEMRFSSLQASADNYGYSIYDRSLRVDEDRLVFASDITRLDVDEEEEQPPSYADVMTMIAQKVDNKIDLEESVEVSEDGRENWPDLETPSCSGLPPV